MTGTSIMHVCLVLDRSGSMQAVREDALGGVNSYIQKPVDLSKFQEAVKQFGTYWLVVNHAPPESASLPQ